MTQMEIKLFSVRLLIILIYLYSRTQINFTVAIDFTASNGEYYDCRWYKISAINWNIKIYFMRLDILFLYIHTSEVCHIKFRSFFLSLYYYEIDIQRTRRNTPKKCLTVPFKFIKYWMIIIFVSDIFKKKIWDLVKPIVSFGPISLTLPSSSYKTIMLKCVELSSFYSTFVCINIHKCNSNTCALCNSLHFYLTNLGGLSYNMPCIGIHNLFIKHFKKEKIMNF